MKAIGFEQSKADPCVFRKVVDGEAEMVVVVHVDDILAHETMDRFVLELGRKFKLKDMGDGGGKIWYQDGKQGTGCVWGANALESG